jgi:AcrR family transcriptional regulator
MELRGFFELGGARSGVDHLAAAGRHRRRARPSALVVTARRRRAQGVVSRQRRAGRPVNTTVSDKPARGTQPERLLAAIVDVAAEQGYERATIARVIAQAGVSRASFYEHFSDREGCFLAALASIQADVLAELAGAIDAQPPQRAAAAAIGALLAFVERDPGAARVLMNEAMAAGPRGLDARDEGLLAAAGLVEDAYSRLPASTRIPDVPPALLLGATYRLLAARLRRGERGLEALKDDLLGWIASYARASGDHRWRTLNLLREPARSPFVPQAPLRAPQPLTAGRPRRSDSAVAENQRLRIMFATASVVQEHGYLGCTVAQITRAAGVDARVFYRLFNDKQDAFMAVREFGFERTIAVTAGAFFAAESWPERIWEAARALTQCLQQNPSLSHVSLIESHAGGAKTVQRFEDLMGAFTIFLQEGYQYAAVRDGGGPSALGLEALSAANLEALYAQARCRTPAMAGLLAHISYMCFAPFVGARRSERLIDKLLAGEAGARPGARAEG